MRKLLIFLLIAIMVVVSACSQKEQEKPDSFVLVQGGTFMNKKSNYYEKNATIANFYIGKYEVTQKGWVEVMGNNPSKFKGNNLPVEMVSWYDCVEYCNKRSVKEDLTPYYNIDKDDIKWKVMINSRANGYRLPTEKEWEYAAGGGQMSKSYTYSGSNNVDKVAWYWKNSGDKQLSGEWNWSTIENNNSKTKSIGSKKSNELGLYDMSGNVREWCWDLYGAVQINNESFRVFKGGGWLGDAHCCELSYQGNYEENSKGYDQGFRVCRSE